MNSLVMAEVSGLLWLLLMSGLFFRVSNAEYCWDRLRFAAGWAKS
jgi:hypothetical protein